MRPIPVRLTPQQLDWLDSQLAGVGITRSQAIRLCVAQAMASGPLQIPTSQPSTSPEARP